MTNKVSSLRKPTTPPVAYHYATSGVPEGFLAECGPDQDVIARIDGRTGEIVYSVAYPRKFLDSDSSDWIRASQPWLLDLIKYKRIGSLAEAMCLIYAMARMSWSGIAEINQSKLADLLGVGTPRSINRAMSNLVGSGVLKRIAGNRPRYAVPGGIFKGKAKDGRK